MRKLLIAVLGTIIIASSAFSADLTNVNSKVISSFKSDFPSATEVHWKSFNAYSCATFFDGDKTVDAFYNYNGDLVGTSSKISLDELSTRAKRIIASKWADYTVTGAVKFNATEETAYFVSLENEKETVVIKVMGSLVAKYYATRK